METRYLLPATIAASLHVIALFGFNHSPTVVRPTTDPKPPVLKPFPVDVIDRPEPEDPPDTPVREPKGEPNIVPPGLDEPAVKPTAEITMPLPPAARPNLEVTRIIPPGVPGVPDGVEGGAGHGPVMDFTKLDNTPRARVRVAPSYPGELRSSGISGEVLVAFVVDESGRVARAWVVRSTDSRFESATLRAVERWRFEPGKKNGCAVSFRMEVPVMFSLAE